MFFLVQLPVLISATKPMFLQILDPTKHADFKNSNGRILADYPLSPNAQIYCLVNIEHQRIENVWSVRAKNQATTIVRIRELRNSSNVGLISQWSLRH